MTFRRRTYPEVLDNLLTSITKGVAAESHRFPPADANGGPYVHKLLQPKARDEKAVVSIYGRRDGQPHEFRKNVDYRLSSDLTSIEWIEAAELPDPGTLIDINYYPASAQADLTDIHTGSVIRTLSESVALELARLYAQLEVVHKSGFIDSATGSSLDKVVAILGIARVRGGRPTGEVEFTRAAGSRGAITISSGTRVITSDGNVEYETTASVTMAESQGRIRVSARDLEVNERLPAGSLTILPVPINGIEGVTNPAPTAISTQDETDAALRERAKNFLHGSERATLGAIKEAIARQGITADVVEVEDKPGVVEITPHAETLPPELHQRLLTAIEDSRPAGVKVQLIGVRKPRAVDLELLFTTTGGLLEQDLRAAQRAASAAIQDYFARLTVEEDGSVNQIVGRVLAIPEVADVRIISATWTVDGVVENVLDREAGRLNISGVPTVLGDLQIADPSLPTRLNVIVNFTENDAPPDSAAVRNDIANALAYWNEVNASELADDVDDATRQKRVLSFGKLLLAVSLPGKAGQSVAQYDDDLASGAASPLPDETNVTPYQLQFVFTMESGVSRLLTRGADDPYKLTPFERLSLSGLEIQTQNSND